MVATIEAMQPEALFPTPPDPRLPRIHALLLERYGRPEPRVPWDPLTQFIYSLLSSRTKTPESHQVMRNLRAPLRRLGRAARRTRRRDRAGHRNRTLADVKAPRLKAALEQITARVGSLTLDFLAKYRTDKIRQWLEQFEGVGRKSLPRRQLFRRCGGARCAWMRTICAWSSGWR